MNNKTTKGFLCVIIAALMWASSSIVAKFLFQGGMAPSELVQARVTLSAAILAVFYGAFARPLFRIRARDVFLFILLGGIFMAFAQFTFFYAISKIKVMAAVLLEYMAPVLVGCYSMIFWSEPITRIKLISLFLAGFGCYLVIGGYDLNLLLMNRIGIIAGLASAVFFAAYMLLGERLMYRYSPWTTVFYVMVFAAIVWNLILLPFEFASATYTPMKWTCILYVVVIGTIIPHGLYFVGVSIIRSTRAAITATLEPIFTGVLSFIVLGEQFDYIQIVGAITIIMAIILLKLQYE